MIGSNGKPLTDSEYHGVYQDTFDVLVKNTFVTNDILVFLTYQPEVLTLDSNQVTGHTHQLLCQFPYLEVLEQNFKYNNLYNYGEYIDGFHSHIIIRECDYKRLSKQQLSGLDIVAKVVWDLDRLINKYLSKQAGQTRSRLLPTSHIPRVSFETISEKINHVTKIKTSKVLVTKVIQVFQNVLINQILPKCFKRKNKIDWIHMFVDDT